jgi:hypothetical protein
MGVGSGLFATHAFVVESTFGTTPGSPSMKPLPSIGGTISPTANMEAIYDMGSQRQVREMVPTSRISEGSLDVQFAYADFDELLAGALFGAWSSNVAKAGITPKSFTIEERHPDITNGYLRHRGAMVNGVSISAQPEQIVSATFDILARETASAATSLGSASALVSAVPFVGFSGALIDGAQTLGRVSGIELSIANNLQPIYGMSIDQLPFELAPGMVNVTGTVSFYLESLGYIDKFLSNTAVELLLTLADALGNQLEFSMPAVKFTGTSRDMNRDGPIILGMPFSAYLDSGIASSIQLTRTPAA